MTHEKYKKLMKAAIQKGWEYQLSYRSNVNIFTNYVSLTEYRLKYIHFDIDIDQMRIKKPNGEVIPMDLNVLKN